jgi:serine/threonine protein kinase
MKKKKKYIFFSFRYHIRENEALAFSNFISPMLKHLPSERISANKSLENEWLKMEQKYDFKMDEEEYAQFMSDQEILKNTNSEGEEEPVPLVLFIYFFFRLISKVKDFRKKINFIDKIFN